MGSRVKFQGTPEEFQKTIDALISEGLDVRVESVVPIELEGEEFEFSVITILTLIRLSEQLAERLQCSPEEVEQSFITAACYEALGMSQEGKLELVTKFYSCFTRR